MPRLAAVCSASCRCRQAPRMPGCLNLSWQASSSMYVSGPLRTQQLASHMHGWVLCLLLSKIQSILNTSSTAKSHTWSSIHAQVTDRRRSRPMQDIMQRNSTCACRSCTSCCPSEVGTRPTPCAYIMRHTRQAPDTLVEHLWLLVTSPGQNPIVHPPPGVDHNPSSNIHAQQFSQSYQRH
jgi:hypothetical protein